MGPSVDRRWTGFKAGFWTGYYIELDIHRVALAVSLGSLSCLYKKIIFAYNDICVGFSSQRKGEGQDQK